VGKERDAESGLYYYGARYYAAWTCRFISVDPLADKYVHLTAYNYAGNKPIGDYDIDGMQGSGDTTSGGSQQAESVNADSNKTPEGPNIIVNAGEEPKAPPETIDGLKAAFEKDKSLDNYLNFEKGKKDWADYETKNNEYKANKDFLEGVKNEILKPKDSVMVEQKELLYGKSITLIVTKDLKHLGQPALAKTTTYSKDNYTIEFDRQKISSGSQKTTVVQALQMVYKDKNFTQTLNGIIVHELGHVIFNSENFYLSPTSEQREEAAMKWEVYYYRSRIDLFRKISSIVYVYDSELKKDINIGPILSMPFKGHENFHKR
jgi:RHS repeat-associated protein